MSKYRKRNLGSKTIHPTSATLAPLDFYPSGRSSSRFDQGFDDDGPSYWQPGVALPMQTPPPLNAIDNTTPSSRSYAAPHRLLHKDLTDEGPADHLEPLRDSLYNNHQIRSSGEVRSDELNQTLKEILSNQKCFQQQMETLIKRVDTIEGSIMNPSSSSSDAEKMRKKRIPSTLSVKIATIYQAMEADKKFNLDHRSNSPTNVAVKNQIKQELQLEKENDFSPEQIDIGIRRYFESRKRLHRESFPSQKERVMAQDQKRKMRARRQRLFDRRKKNLKGKEPIWWEQLSIDYMSYESSDNEDKDVMVVHSIPWRSKKLNQFIEELDDRAEKQRKATKHYAADRKQRRAGDPADSTPPENAPKWAVNKEWLKGNARNEDSTSKPPSASDDEWTEFDPELDQDSGDLDKEYED